MTGRHRAPAPPVNHRRHGGAALAGMTLAATTSSGLFLSDIAAAAPASVDWDKVAACESTQRWDANTGNGYSGGLQFLPATWRAFGGLEFAPVAHQASREQQIVVAERIRAGGYRGVRPQGIGAWPVCGPKGLGGTTKNAGTPAPPARPAPRTPARPPAVPDQPRVVQEAVAASGPTNPACQSLKRRGVKVAQLDALDRAHPELLLDGNRNGVPCDVSFPRGTASSSTPRTSSPAPKAPTNVGVSTASAKQASAAAATKGDRIVATARTWIGTRYRFGGESGRFGSGVDCSSFVQQVMRENGITVPRVSRDQAQASRRITRAELRPGDLVFGVYPGGTVHHVGIYIGDGLQIDAPRDGIPVGIHKLYRDQTRFGRVTG